MKEDKIRYRAYKKGKFWVFAAIVTSSTLLAFGGRAYADTVTSTEDKVSMTVEEQTQSTTSPISDTTSTEVTSKSEATELSSSESSISTSSQSDQITTAETVMRTLIKLLIVKTKQVFKTHQKPLGTLALKIVGVSILAVMKTPLLN